MLMFVQLSVMLAWSEFSCAFFWILLHVVCFCF